MLFCKFGNPSKSPAHSEHPYLKYFCLFYAVEIGGCGNTLFHIIVELEYIYLPTPSPTYLHVPA